MQTTIGDIVDEFLIEKGYNGRHQYERVLNLAIRGLKEIWYDVSGVLSWTELTLDSNNTSAIPCGLINVVRMYMNIDGYGLCELALTTRMTPTIVENNGDVEERNINPQNEYNNFAEGSYYYNGNTNFRFGQFVGGIYKGVGSNPFVYRRNYDTNRFEFSSNVKNPVLEYLTDPSMVDGEYMVDPLIENALLYWLYYADSRFKRSVGAGEKRVNHQNYVAAKNHARMRMQNITPSNMRSAVRDSYSLTQK